MLRTLAPLVLLASCGPPPEPCVGSGGSFGRVIERPLVHVVSVGRSRTVDLAFPLRGCLPLGSTWARGEIISPSGQSTPIEGQTIEGPTTDVVARVALGPFASPGVWQLKLFVEPALGLEQVPIYVVEELGDAGVVESFARPCVAPTRSQGGTTYCFPQPPQMEALAQRDGVARTLPRTREAVAVGAVVWTLETTATGGVTLNRYLESDGGLTPTVRPTDLSTTSQIFNYVDEDEVLLSAERFRHDGGALTRLERTRTSRVVFALVDRGREASFGSEAWCVSDQCTMLRPTLEPMGYDQDSVWFSEQTSNPVTAGAVLQLVQSRRPLGETLSESTWPAFPGAPPVRSSQPFEATVAGRVPVLPLEGGELVFLETRPAGPVFRRLRGVLVRATRDWLFVSDREGDRRLRAVKVGP